MVSIKVSTPWNHIDFSERISAHHSEYQFFFDDSIKECDYWIVWGGIKGLQESAICPPGNVIYLTDEVFEVRMFNKYFLDQFASIITCRTDIKHPSIIPSHELNTWMIDKEYDELLSDENIPKSKMLSVICSDQTWLPGHKTRYAFVNKLIGHFKDRLDVFGKGFNPIADKYEGLANYKYSVAIENSVIPGYFTEKISDCYLSDTMPIYYGCPDIEKYFEKESLLLIDPNNFKDSVNGIEKLLEEDPYDQLLPIIKKQRKKYLKEYHIFNKLVKILSSEFKSGGNKTEITIKNERCFQRGYTINNLISAAFRKLHLPGKLFFEITFQQDNTYANNAVNKRGT